MAIDALGVLPTYFYLTEGKSHTERQKIVRQSIFTAFLVTVGFILMGKGVFGILGIKVEDFMIAGGLLLMVFAVTDILREGPPSKITTSTLGVVPLGTPLIAGPATLTTALILVGTHGLLPVLGSLTVNLLFAWLVFAQAERIIALIGISGSRAIAKVAGLLLAAIGVSMIRRGIMGLRGG